jgi:diadenosine tetraphosphate (Ap4A) HIT family hydrolase
MQEQCLFCQRALDDVLIFNEAAVAFRDGFPVTDGHTLVVPRRHVTSVFELAPAEFAGIWQLVWETRASLSSEFKLDGFTVGVNDGLAAGQTIAHGHIHVIPRRVGDVVDPRGGVRWVIPEKAAYWST